MHLGRGGELMPVEDTVTLGPTASYGIVVLFQCLPGTASVLERMKNRSHILVASRI